MRKMSDAFAIESQRVVNNTDDRARVGMKHAHRLEGIKPESLVIAKNSPSIRVFLVNGYPCILWGLEQLIIREQPVMQIAGTATSCADASDRIDDASPDVILLDFDSDPGDVVADISNLTARSSAKILVLTGIREESAHGKFVLAGASGVVRKEEPDKAIVAAIETVHHGHMWLNQSTMGRIFDELSRKRGGSAVDPEQAKISTLSKRETEVVAIVCNHPGTKGSTLARILDISDHTLRNHLTSIYRKLEVPNRIAMFAYANKHGLPLTSQSA